MKKDPKISQHSFSVSVISGFTARKIHAHAHSGSHHRDNRTTKKMAATALREASLDLEGRENTHLPHLLEETQYVLFHYKRHIVCGVYICRASIEMLEKENCMFEQFLKRLDPKDFQLKGLPQNHT